MSWMKWEKLGQIFCPDNNYDWMRTHAANPVAEHVSDDLFRIYFSCRNSNNQASIAFVEIDIANPKTILKMSDTPVLSPGEIGAFDDSGVSMGYLVRTNDKRYLYYLGWNLGVTVPWRNSIGLAISESANGEFRRISKAPVMDRNDIDPFSISYPCVIRDHGIWKMWYGSNLKWGTEQEDMAHLIKYAESQDGVLWQRNGLIALDFKDKSEYAMSKPCVIKDGDVFKMWYSFRGAAYRIGYAESKDGKIWERQDEAAGINVSDSGWDSETIEYPHVFDHKGSRFMVYNGNGYGKTGFGLAKLNTRTS